MKALPNTRCELTTVPGSIKHYAAQHNTTFALAWLSVQAVILFDRSASMDTDDAPGKQTRYQLAIAELTKLQAQCPGRLAIVQFNDECSLMPGGVPDAPRGTTDLTGALEYVRRLNMDTPGMRIVIISDGEPNNQSSALESARQFKNRIDVVYTGPADDDEGGRAFLQRLSLASGGQLVTAQCASGLMQATLKLLAVA